MFNAESLKQALVSGSYEKTFEKLYPNKQNVAERYVRVVDKFVNKYGFNELNNVAKIHFKNTEKVLEKIKKA